MSAAVEAKTEALKHKWYIYDGKLAIVKRITDDDTTDWGDPDKSKVVTYFGTKIDSTAMRAGTTDISVPDIPNEFHNDLSTYVVMKLYEMDPDTIPAAQYHRKQWERAKAKAKQRANRAGDGSQYTIQQHEY